jgi:putative membrane protein
MHLGKSYKLSEFLFWTRRKVYVLLVCGSVPVILYRLLGITWLCIPLTIVVLLGTATSFIVGFKNVQTYNRAMEAQAIWTHIVGASRRWGQLVRDLVDDRACARALANRHIAWLTALRFELRKPRIWESTQKRFNTEYLRHYRVPEWESNIGELLPRYLPRREAERALACTSIATCVLSLQGTALKALHADGHTTPSAYMQLQASLSDLFSLQAETERLKNFPYPRQYATVSALFVKFFCLLFPFGLLQEFDKLNEFVNGFMHGNMVWLVVPCSTVVSWMYASLEQVGESTENPFEGGANDVPITMLCNEIERDILDMFGEHASDRAEDRVIAL